MSDMEGTAAARRYARWHLGDPHWADEIIRAYKNPAVVNDELDKEQQ